MRKIIEKTHLIVTDVQNKYYINWCGKIADTKPFFKNGKPIFIVIGSKGTKGRIELNTTSMKQIEKSAKLMTVPHGRGAVATDSARIFIKEADGGEKLIGILTHNRVKSYAPMYDVIGYEKD